MTDDKRTAVKLEREKQVKKQKKIIVAVLIVILTVILIYMISVLGKKNKEETIETSNMKQSEEIQAVSSGKEEEKEETQEERLRRVKRMARKEDYPEGVIELLSKNPDTVDFVENYGEKKDLAPVKEIKELKKGVIPHLLQWDQRWGYAPYGTSIVAASGCGPTCLSMVFSGLTGDKTLTPAKMAEYGTENHYVNEHNDTYWSFMAEAGQEWGIITEEKKLEEDQLKKELKAGHPMICVVGPGDFTKIGHFIVFVGYENGKVIVHDPFSIQNTEKRWKYNDIKDQIKSMWIYQMDEE